MIQTLRNKYPHTPIGYSGHETGLAPTWASISLGANFIERHITLDRSMYGSDQAASIELQGFKRLVDYIRTVELALGDGIKRITAAEEKVRQKLQRSEDCA